MFTAVQTNDGVETETFSDGKAKESQPNDTTTTSDEASQTTYFSSKTTEEEESGKETNQNQETSTEKTNEKSEVKVDESQKPSEEEETKKPTFKVNRPETGVKTETSKPEDNKETYSVSDESVLKYLKTKGIEVESLDQVTKKSKLPDAVEEFRKFNEKTGGGIKAFYNSQKDWKAEPKNSTLKEYYKYQNPGVSDDDINTQLELLSVTEDEQDELSERELKQRNLEYNKEYNKALKFMNGITEEYNIAKEDQTAQVQKPPTPEEIEVAHRPWREQRDKSLENLNEISLPIEGLGDIKLPVTQEQKDLILNNTQTQEAFFEPWKKEDGTLDSDKVSLDMAWANPKIRDQFISDLLTEAHTLWAEDFSKTTRNVTLGKPKEDKVKNTNGSMTVFNGNENSTVPRMGTPIFTR